MRPALRLLATFTAFALASCGESADENLTRIAFVGEETDLLDNGLRLAPAGQHLRAATAEGLVGLNANGEIVPAMAERWIVTEDGLSYIFRLRNSSWPDGTRLSGDNVLDSLNRNLRALRGTSLGIDLSIIRDTRAMTGRVIEVRLQSPMPQFLQLLAQPELGLRREGLGTGPMTAEVTKNMAMLNVADPELHGAPDFDDWQDQFRQVQIFTLAPADAASAFDNAEVDAVFNGHLLSLPLANTGPLSRGTVRLDVVYGLFGLQISNTDGLLSEQSRREALAMAIEREDLLEPFGIGGWAPSTRMVPQELLGDSRIASERWANMDIAERKSEARRRIAAWRSSQELESVRMTISLPRRAGSNLFYEQLSEDLRDIGINLVRVGPDDIADLRLVDRLARYGDARWFLNQFNCALEGNVCVPAADELVELALVEPDAARKTDFYLEAEAELLQSNMFIPIGAPVRWSLVRGGVDGFAANPWGLHPLFPLAIRPI